MPNIIQIIADDLSWNDVGFHGCEIKTSVIDGEVAERNQFRRIPDRIETTSESNRRDESS